MKSQRLRLIFSTSSSCTSTISGVCIRKRTFGFRQDELAVDHQAFVQDEIPSGVVHNIATATRNSNERLFWAAKSASASEYTAIAAGCAAVGKITDFRDDGAKSKTLPKTAMGGADVSVASVESRAKRTTYKESN